jgi:hypothetical protein
MTTNAAKERSLGIAACTAIVVGNMVGSGFYLSPSAVAPYGSLAILVWALMGGGAICLGLTFAKLARIAAGDRRPLPAIGIMLSATLATIPVIIQAAGTSGFQSRRV